LDKFTILEFIHQQIMESKLDNSDLPYKRIAASLGVISFGKPY
jgi:hypothetical protein